MRKLKKRLNNFFVFFLLSISLSCSAQHSNRQKTVYDVILLEDSIENPYVYLNELKVNIPETKNPRKLIVNIQGLSENKELRSANPKKRLALKKELLKNCLQQKEATCLYIPEKYEILYNARSVLSLKYCYNSFGNRDEYYKYACFDLKTGERITYEEMFLNPEEILQIYNEKYVREITDYLRALKTEEDEEAKEEFEIFQEHLKTRKPFGLKDLNNWEPVFNDFGRLVKIKLHYNGEGGLYRKFFPPGYIEFSTEVLRSELKVEFKEIFKV